MTPRFSLAALLIFVTAGAAGLGAIRVLFPSWFYSPRASVRQTEFDFGPVSRGERRCHEFEISNVGYVNLRVLRVGAENHITSTTGELELKPGEQAFVRVECRIPQYAVNPTYEQRLQLHTNDPSNPVIWLAVRGLINAEPPPTDDWP